MTTAFGALTQRIVRRVVFASTFSNLAAGILLGALPLAVAARGASPLLVGLTAASMTVWWLGSVPLSLLVDRVGPGTVLRVVVPARGASAMVIAAHALVHGSASQEMIMAGAFLYGFCEVLADTAGAVLPALLLAEEFHDDAYALLQGGGRAADLVVGPAAGALLLACNSALPFVVVSACLALSFAGYRPLLAHPGAAPNSSRRGRWWRDVVSGVRHIARNRFLVAVTITLTGVIMSEQTIATVAAPYVRDGPMGNLWEQLLGGLRSISGICGIIAAVFAGTLARRFSRHRVLCVVAGVAAVSPAVLAVSPTWTAVLGSFVLSAVAEGVWVPLVQAEFARRTPPELLARTRAAILFLVWGSVPVTSVLAGGLTHAIGIQEVLLIVTGFALLGAVAGVWRVLGFRHTPESR